MSFINVVMNDGLVGRARWVQGARSFESKRLRRGIRELRFGARTVTISYPVFPLIPPYSVSDLSKSLFFLDLV